MPNVLDVRNVMLHNMTPEDTHVNPPDTEKLISKLGYHHVTVCSACVVATTCAVDRHGLTFHSKAVDGLPHAEHDLVEDAHKYTTEDSVGVVIMSHVHV